VVNLHHMKVHIEFPNGQLVQGHIQSMEIQSTTQATKIKLEAIILDAGVLVEAWNSPRTKPPETDPPEPPELVKRNTTW